MNSRSEHDSLGEVKVPNDAYWGAQTHRAVQNFPISGIRPFKVYVKATAMIKRAAAEANWKSGLLDEKKAKAIMEAADEIIDGKYADQFIVDVYQAGGGTSHHMNVNEVIANRAIELLGGKKGQYELVHPNDHVNMGQSTIDVIPTAVKLSCIMLNRDLLANLNILITELASKASVFDEVIKVGRTHLMDATPIRLGQEFEAWKRMVEKDRSNIDLVTKKLGEVNIGATVGTGLNAEPEYVRNTIEILSKLMHFPLRKADYFPEVTQSSAGFLELSSSLRTLACNLLKITNDLRLMNSGPIAGFSEIVLPSLQPGSTIFPGKVNPVVPEAVQMVCYQVIGLDTAICLCAHAGQLELNATLPLIALDLMHSLQIMTSATKILAEKSIHGIVANTEKMRSLAERNPSIAMALNPHIGYEKSTAIVKRALAEGKTIKEVVLEMKVLPVDLVERIFEPHELTEPGIPGKKKQNKQ